MHVGVKQIENIKIKIKIKNNTTTYHTHTPQPLMATIASVRDRIGSNVRSLAELHMAESSQMPVPHRRAKFSRVDVPDHIRENLPEELSDLPADLIYATDLNVYEFSYSKAGARAVEAHNSLIEKIQADYGLGILIPWPQWVQRAAQATHAEVCRLSQKQEDAQRWVEENRCPTPSDEEAGSVDQLLQLTDVDGRMAS